MNSEEFGVELADNETLRADKFVASLGLFTRSQISRRSVRIRDSRGVEIKFSQKLRNGDVVTVDWDDPAPSEIEPEDVPLDVLYEDAEALVINKPQGMVVHPAHGHLHGTLVQGLLYRYAGWDTIFGGDRVRPGIVHRLDKDTSGLIVAAKSPEVLEKLAKQFRKRSVEKTYLAISRGQAPSSGGELDMPIGRDPRDRKKNTTDGVNPKKALTSYELLFESNSYSLLKLGLHTGRTHQIRVHLKAISCPILGDPIYSRKDARFPDATLMLHSWKLTINLPGAGVRSFVAPVPRRFVEILSILKIPLPE